MTARLAAGLSVERAAARAGLSARTIYNIETYRHAPTATTRRALADALGEDESALFPHINDVSRPQAAHGQENRDEPSAPRCPAG